MREIHQSTYNSDELAWEVILEIVEQLGAKGVEVSEKQFDADRATFDQLEANHPWADPEALQSAEDSWRAVGERHGIVVYDDGEAGWTYVGTEQEINVMLTTEGGY